MKKSVSVLAVMCVLIFASVSQAVSVIYVDVSGPNDPGSGSVDDPFRKIQDAIDDANDGDIIEIRPGIYTEPGNYNLDPNGLPITIRSTDPNDPDVVSATIIDPNGAGRGFYFHRKEDANCVISGFTIRNGYSGEDQSGGGIFCDDSSPTILNCIITSNSSDMYGGAIYCDNSNSQFKNCTISDNNSIGGGGALECWSGSPQLTNCVISNNHCISYGGAVDCYSQGNPILINCTLIKNSAYDGIGGAICSWDSDVNIKNSIIWANEAVLGGQLALLYGGSASVSYCNVQGGKTEVYVDTGCVLAWDATSNVNVDPCFASFDLDGVPNVWDFHLQSAYGRWEPNSRSWVRDVNTSLCIDAGDPNSDYTCELWPHGKQINMGAFGGTNQASMSQSDLGNIADLDNNNEVYFTDLRIFTKRWLSSKKLLAEDLNRDGIVNFKDFAIFAKSWLWQEE